MNKKMVMTDCGGGEVPKKGQENLEDISDTESLPGVPAILKQKPTYQTKPYKSAEERIFVDSGIRDFLAYGGKALYGTIATLFRVPTFIRKCINYQTLAQRELDKLKSNKLNEEAPVGGFLFGASCGLGFDAVFLKYSIDELNKKNYLPLAIWAGTNLLFGAHELGRLSKSREERLGVKAQKEAKKLQKAAEEVKRTGDDLKSEVNKAD